MIEPSQKENINNPPSTPYAYAEHIAGLSGIPCRVLEITERRMSGSCCADGCRLCENDTDIHMYGCSEAYRWGGRYIYYCPLGMVFASASLTGSDGTLTGGLVSGPAVMGNMLDVLDELDDEKISDAVSRLTVVSTAKMHHLSEIMGAVAAGISGTPLGRAGALVHEQEKILTTLYEVRGRLSGDSIAPKTLIEGEKLLRDKILKKDKSGAQELLNELLGTIYFSHEFNLEHIKSRIIELIVLLSRAGIDAGGDIGEILLSNTGYIRKIENFRSLEELSLWVTGIMHRFIQYTFDFSRVKHSNVVYKVMEYVKSHYNEKITLDDIARHVYLSRTYLSSMFAEETGQSLFSYINYIRVEKSKHLLRDPSIRVVDVAGLCGFDDQSYFTKVFRKQTGMSPKKYRDSHREL